MGSDQVIFLHGFWGQASDWNFLKPAGFKKSFEALNYTQDPLLSPDNFISDWGQNFINWKRAHFGSEQLTVVGYSQGGRLLLNALAAAPGEFHKVVLISAHPGLTDFAEKESRLNHDRQWDKKFRTLPWDQLQAEWDSQGVFQSREAPKRAEKDFDRNILALCLENWSLAHQSNFRDLINRHSNKINIILGEQDIKYVKIYQEFLKDFTTLKMEKGAAHRVPFDQPNELVETLNSII